MCVQKNPRADHYQLILCKKNYNQTTTNNGVTFQIPILQVLWIYDFRGFVSYFPVGCKKKLENLQKYLRTLTVFPSKLIESNNAKDVES